jgi:hypothetical protein
MRPPAIDVSAIRAKDDPQVRLTEDQDAVGDFGSGRDQPLWRSVVGRGTRSATRHLRPGEAGEGVNGAPETSAFDKLPQRTMTGAVVDPRRPWVCGYLKPRS